MYFEDGRLLDSHNELFIGCDCLDTCTRVCHSQQGFVPMVLDSLSAFFAAVFLD